MKFQSNLIKFKGNLYYYNPIASAFLLIYNIDSDKIYEGPFIGSDKNRNAIFLM
jgi:hypothetical protein